MKAFSILALSLVCGFTSVLGQSGESTTISPSTSGQPTTQQTNPPQPSSTQSTNSPPLSSTQPTNSPPLSSTQQPLSSTQPTNSPPLSSTQPTNSPPLSSTQQPLSSTQPTNSPPLSSTQPTNPPQPSSTQPTTPNSSGQPTSPGPSTSVGPNGNPLTEAEFQCAATTKGGSPDSSLYQGFINYLSDASISTRREAAMYLAHTVWETGGYQSTRETACQTNMESCRKVYPNDQGGEPGIVYYGRGMLQLTWDYNYKAASSALYGDNRLIVNPEPVADDPDMWKTAAWFWQTKVHANTATFGDTLKAINGAEECDGGKHPENRIKRFNNYKDILSKCMSMPTPPDSDGYCHV